MPAIPQSRRIPRPVWLLAQAAGVLLTAALAWGLVRRPEPTLRLLWDLVIPVLPAVFLVNPMLWRNVCPLATLNQVTGRRRGGALDPRLLRLGWAAGILLLALMVPARRFLFNHDGTALAVTIVVVGGLALVTGLVAPRRAGFCNSLCPVLPVEKLYGQAPLVSLGGPRCVACDVCTPAGCIDLAGARSARQSVGGHRGAAWLASPFGIFAAGFPGFVVGYFTAADGGLATAGSVYMRVVGGALASLLLVAAMVMAIRPSATAALRWLGGGSAALYYWYAAPGIAAFLGAGSAGSAALRGAALALVAFWLWRAHRPGPRAALPGGALRHG